MYNDLERMGRHLMDDHGPRSRRAWVVCSRISSICALFRRLGVRSAPDIIEVIAAQPTLRTPRLRPDVVWQHYGDRPPFPRARPRTLHPGSLARCPSTPSTAALTPGSNASTLYHYLIAAATSNTSCARGIGSLSTALCRRAESLGAEVQMKQHVKQILVTTDAQPESNYATAQRFPPTRCSRRSTLTPRS